MCHFCTMTIVEKGFGAEVVTKKGKVYKFDAIECMMNYIVRPDAEEFALYGSNILVDPGVLYDATSLTFLRAEAVPSPMGAFLSAHIDKEGAEQILEGEPGEFYSWEELVTYFQTNNR